MKSDDRLSSNSQSLIGYHMTCFATERAEVDWWVITPEKKQLSSDYKHNIRRVSKNVSTFF